jgi:hypothetical protein
MNRKMSKPTNQIDEINRKKNPLTHCPTVGPPDLSCRTPMIAFPSSNGFVFQTPSRPKGKNAKAIKQKN